MSDLMTDKLVLVYITKILKAKLKDLRLSA